MTSLVLLEEGMIEHVLDLKQAVICPSYKIYYFMTYPKGKFNALLTYP
jgi:hypothetical protein